MRVGFDEPLGVERRELGLQTVDVELEERLRTVDVLEPVGAERPHDDTLDLVLDEFPRRV